MKIIGLICILVVGLTSCKKGNKPLGFNLQRFNVVKPQLDSVIHSLNETTYFKESFAEGRVLIMVLRVYDSKPEFCFTTAEKKEIAEYYIFSNNKRIVGFIEHEKVDFIVLSLEPNKTDFESVFYEYVHPTMDKRYFDYIYFPDDMYAAFPDGKPLPPPFFDPHYYCFVQTDNKIVPNMLTNELERDTVQTNPAAKAIDNDSNSVSVFLDYEFVGEVQIFDDSSHVIKTVKNDLEEESIVLFELLEKNDSMYYVAASWALNNDLIVKGWIYKNNHLGIFSAAYNRDFILYKEPYNREKIVATDKEYNPEMYEVTDFEGKWLKIKAKIKNRLYNGWIPPEMQCSNVYSTCN